MSDGFPALQDHHLAARPGSSNQLWFAACTVLSDRKNPETHHPSPSTAARR